MSRTAVRRRPAAVALVVTVVSALLALATGLPAAGAPPDAPPSGSATLTVRSDLPSPTAPPTTRAPQGAAPDGTTIGGGKLGTRGVAAVGSGLPTDLSAQSFLVADLGTGAVLAAKDPHGRRYPASTLKTLLIVSLFPELDLDRMVTVTTADVTIEGSAAGLVAGGRYSVRTLWEAVLLQSDNQAANALARTYGGVGKTVSLMNKHARELDAYDTVAGTPSGLDVVGQSSSAYDLCLFMRQIVEHADILKIASTRTAVMPAQPPKYGAFQFQNQNRLLANYPGTLAGKTGFTDAARHTFVAAARRDGRTLVVALMRGEQQPVPMWQQAAQLLDWGFGTPKATTGVGTLVEPGTWKPAATSAPASVTTPSAVPRPTASASPGLPAGSAASAGTGPGFPLVPVLGVSVVCAGLLTLFVRRLRRGG